MKRMRARFSVDLNMGVLLFLVVIAVSTSVFSAILNPDKVDKAWWSGWLQNLSAEMIGAVVTFLLFDMIVKAHQERIQKMEREAQHKRHLVRKAGNIEKAIALDALNEMRERHWISGERSILQNEDFYNADWSGANLDTANLRSARLRHANLQGAFLVNAYLTNAILRDVTFNADTTLPDDTQYDPNKGVEQLDKFIDGSWYEENEGWWTKKDE
jgi:hypothetical protein